MRRLEDMSWTDIKQDLPRTADRILKAYEQYGGLLPFKQGYVYLIHAIGSDFYKIGKSIKPDRRILQISPVMPFKIRFVRVWPTNFMDKAEKYLHNFFMDERVNGEWFSFKEEELNSILAEYTVISIRHAGIEDFFSVCDFKEIKELGTIDRCSAFEMFDAMVNPKAGINFIERIFGEILVDDSLRFEIGGAS
jgi:hypothetical protein